MSIALKIISLPSWILFILVLLFCVLCAETGSFIAQTRRKKGVTEPAAPVGTSVTAMLGLLAFMLSFTFSITASRFAERKGLVIEQANAIGTCYLRTSFIPDKQKQGIRKLFQDYVTILLQLENQTDPEKSIARLEELHLLLWEQTASLGKEDMDSEIRAHFISSMNAVLDIAEARKTVATIYRIPGMIWVSLFLLTGIGMFGIGIQVGSLGLRRISNLPMLAFAFALVIVLIADMDSTGMHRLKVSQQPLLDLQQTIRSKIP